MSLFSPSKQGVWNWKKTSLMIDLFELIQMSDLDEPTHPLLNPSRYGYGDAEHQAPLATVPPGSVLTYTVELIEHINAKESWDMDDKEKVANAAMLKDKGNQAFKEGRLEKAIK